MLFTTSSMRRLETFHIIAVVGALILLWKICYESITWPLRPYLPTELGASNATLGFEAILVVAPNKSTGGETVWRQEGLLRAAELTGLNVDILPQPNFTMDEVLASITEDRRKTIIEQMEKGGPEGDFTDAEGRLRLGHLHVLKHVMSSNFSTALILEDDADWDVAIREQTPAIANAIRDLTSGVVGPWGFNWDYLALGHCGAGAVKDGTFRLVKDPTTGPAKDHQALWGPEKELKNNTRFVHQTTGTVCTFGYAVSRHGAKKLIDHLSGSGMPLDIDYASFCNGGGLNCYAVTPEIIHHHRWTGHKITSGGPLHGALEPGETEQKFTVNIKHSARCNSDPDVIKAHASGTGTGTGTQKELIQCLPTGLSKEKYSSK